MSIDSSVNDLLNAAGVPTAKFPIKGTKHVGKVVGATTRQARDMDGKPKTWDDGNPMMEVVIDIRTAERDPGIEGDDGTRRLYASGNMLAAIRDAVRKGGGKLEMDGDLAVAYTDDGEVKQRGWNPPKLYAAQYKPPAISEDDMFAGPTAAAAPQPDAGSLA